ncbi:MAG: hypothetical protein M1569_02345 [Candidatus Marsarchaeota archaeon]|nr:hypothetical protein [Candidatus Marsarchaeota archaeon]MCL5413220.1 hypothetical protein [Candidatus Marsarchaeota archaeon]
MEFWNDAVTEESWKRLIELNKEIDMVLIGGWAIYLYTHLSKSKDIDIIVDYNSMRVLSQKYLVEKNDRLKTYEIKLEKFDIDIYLPKYSRLSPPPEDILSKYRNQKEGFTLPTPEALLLLKFSAFMERKSSIKGQKDAIDILGMLFYSGIDFKKMAEIKNTYKVKDLGRTIVSMLRTVDPNSYKYLNLNAKTFSEYKNKSWQQIRSHLL